MHHVFDQVIASSARRWCSALAMLGAVLAAAPASAGEKVFAGIGPENFGKKWSFNDWRVWALPNGSCLALEEVPGAVPFSFWGFQQSPGSRVQVIFGSIENARPQTVQMSFNNGGKFDYHADVRRMSDWDAYVISLQPDALSILPNQLIIEADVGGAQVFLNEYNEMDRVYGKMADCLTWQETH